MKDINKNTDIFAIFDYLNNRILVDKLNFSQLTINFTVFDYSIKYAVTDLLQQVAAILYGASGLITFKRPI